MNLATTFLLYGSWAAFGAYWFYAASKVKQTARAEASTSRLIHIAMFALAGFLVGTDWLRIGPLAWRILPDTWITAAIGAVLTALSVGFAIWARYHLGQYWSGTITIKEGHKLIRTGPYAMVRHPIYTGLGFAVLGTAIAVGEVRGLLAVALVLVAYWRKIQIEERWLTDEFGGDYDRYRREVKALVPFIL